MLAVVATGLILGSGCSSENSESSTKSNAEQVIPVSDANLAAVLIYADWCGNCKILDPKIEKVRNSHNFLDTAFITLDFTAKDKTAFMADAKTAGVAMAVKEHFNGKIKTGQMLLIDVDKKKVIGVINKDMNEPAIAEAIERAASEA